MEYEVKNVQRRLNELGFGPLLVDGISGQRTSAAIIRFKRSVGLAPRDYIGPITLKALFGDPPESDIPWLAEALRLLNLHESRDTLKLKKWFDKSVAWIDPREIPWCGAFEATIYRKWRPEITLPDNPLGAKNWAKFGIPCWPQLGCTLTFHRGSPKSWSGHVANYIGESKNAYYVIGGNQSDAVTKTWIAKDRLHSSRWPEDFPQNNKRVMLNSSGHPLSVNEA